MELDQLTVFLNNSPAFLAEQGNVLTSYLEGALVCWQEAQVLNKSTPNFENIKETLKRVARNLLLFQIGVIDFIEGKPDRASPSFLDVLNEIRGDNSPPLTEADVENMSLTSLITATGFDWGHCVINPEDFYRLEYLCDIGILREHVVGLANFTRNKNYIPAYDECRKILNLASNYQGRYEDFNIEKVLGFNSQRLEDFSLQLIHLASASKKPPLPKLPENFIRPSISAPSLEELNLR